MAVRLVGTGRPFRLLVRPDAFGDPVDVVEVRDHLNRVVDRPIVEAVPPKDVGVVRADRRGGQGQLPRVVAEDAKPGLEVALAVVVLRVPCQLVWGALVTEVVGVRAPSVVALVRRRDDCREQLALLPRER